MRALPFGVYIFWALDVWKLSYRLVPRLLLTPPTALYTISQVDPHPCWEVASDWLAGCCYCTAKEADENQFP